MEHWEDGVTNRWSLLPPRGMLKPAVSGAERPGWSWYVYDRLSADTTTTMTIDLQYNKATVNNPWNPFSFFYNPLKVGTRAGQEAGKLRGGQGMHVHLCVRV